MRKLKIVEHISLDGIIEVGPGTPHGDWSGPYRSPAGTYKFAGPLQNLK